MIALRNVALSAVLNFLLFALMSITVQISLPVKITSAPISFRWINQKVESVKGATKIEKPIDIPKPVAKRIAKPREPEPIVKQERKPEPPSIEPITREIKPSEKVEPAPATTPPVAAQRKEAVALDTQTYFGEKKLSILPSFVSRPLPQYPPLARRAGREGEVILAIWLAPDGTISKIDIVKSAGWGFDKAAMKAAHASRFTPGKIDGRAVRSKVRAPYIFRLD